MSGEPLDVALRVRWQYDPNGASKALGDAEKFRTAAQRLSGSAGGIALARDLRDVSGQAQAADRVLSSVATNAARLGAGDGAVRLTGGLRDAGQAASGVARDLGQLAQVAARFGTVSAVSYLGRDLKAAHLPAQALRGELAAVGKAAEGIGRSRALVALEGDLQAASRRADELDRRLVALARRTAGGRGGHDQRLEFGNEALRASGFGVAGLHLGMSPAAAGGLAVGTGVAGTAAAAALATRQAITFEHAMTEVGKAIGDTTEGMRPLESQFLALSRKTGISGKEIASIAAQGGYFNVPRTQLPEFTDISARAAVGFRMRPEEAGDAFGPLMKSYKLPDMAALRLAGDAVNTVGDSVGVRERDILNYLGRTSGVAGMLKIPLPQNAAIGGAIQSLGVAPDVAATSFDQVARRLANANLHRDPEFSRGLRGIDMNSRQVKALMDQDGVEGVLTVLGKLKDLKPGQRSNRIQDLFGEGEVSNVSRMVESLDTIRSALDKVSDPSKYRGSLEKTFKIFGADTTASIDRAGAALDSFAIRLGQRFDPAVKASADLLARWLGGVVKAMDRGDKAEAMARKMAKGEPVSPAEQAQADADPRLKRQAEERARTLMERGLTTVPEEDRGALERRLRESTLRDLEAQIGRRKARGLDAGDLERQLGASRERFRELYPGDGKPEALPGTGKRSDLQEGVKASLASYHEEVDQSLTRTERLVREFGRRMREDLEIRPKVQDAAFRFGGDGDGGARIEHASLGGSGLGRTPGGGGGGFRGMPGRFGGAIPLPRGGRHPTEGGGPAGGGIEPGGGGRRPPSTAEGRENVASWLAFAQRPVEEGGLGLTKEQAHGLVAGMQGESGANLDPGAWNGNDRGKPAGGTAQWRDDRLRNLQAFAGERGKDWRDRGVQQEFLRHEMVGSGAHGGGSERRAYEAIKRAQTRQEALGAHVEKFERPQFPGAEVRKRSQYLYGHDGAAQADGGARPGRGEAGANGQFDPLGGAARRYSSGFGMRDHPIHGGRRMHNGQDMAAPAGSPVSAMQGGRVTAISRMGDVTVTHPDGSTKTYRHIDPSGIKVGQEIEGGAPIGTLRARDPRSTGPHLHLEATDPKGRRYDPRAEIDEAGRRTRDLAEPRSPRFMDPASYQLKPGVAGDPAAGGVGAGRFGLNGPNVVQHFHTGADAQEVGRRAQLEQNREIRRTMAGALHDGGRPA